MSDAPDEDRLFRLAAWLMISRSIGWALLALLCSLIVLALTYPLGERGLEVFGGASAGVRPLLVLLALFLGARLGRLRGLGQAALLAVKTGLARRLGERMLAETETEDQSALERAGDRVLVLETGRGAGPARRRLMRFLIPRLLRALRASAKAEDRWMGVEKQIGAGIVGLMLGRTVTYLGLAVLAAGLPAILGLLER